MKLAIMQPYFFPYIGYFQLINAVDKFVFYDDVNFIKNGWINRNRILLNGQPQYLTVPLKNASSNKLIYEVDFSDNRLKLLKTLEYTYKKAPFFNTVFPLLTDCLSLNTYKISELAQHSVIKTCEYLEIHKDFEVSSRNYLNTQGLEKVERLQQICLINNCSNYLNLIGGQKLYTKQAFSDKNIEIHFISSNSVNYKQYNNEFVPWLSIIDVLMFNDKENIKGFLNEYNLQ